MIFLLILSTLKKYFSSFLFFQRTQEKAKKTKIKILAFRFSPYLCCASKINKRRKKWKEKLNC